MKAEAWVVVWGAEVLCVETLAFFFLTFTPPYVSVICFLLSEYLSSQFFLSVL